jgi:hypothetical protein
MKTSPAGAEGIPRPRAAGLVPLPALLDEHTLGDFIGRGDGLTPLGDDVVCGWLALYRATGVASAAVDHAVRRLLGRTTALSVALLESALLGDVADPVADYLRALGGPDAPAARDRLTSVGHSSGSGLAHGIDLALRSLDTHRNAA